MHPDRYTRAVLTVIALLLATLVLRPPADPPPVRAQRPARRLYIEPGYTLLRKPDGSAQLKGKVVIDRATGDVWGFPTLADSPYPVDPARSAPPVSSPIYLGRFDFTALRRP